MSAPAKSPSLASSLAAWKSALAAPVRVCESGLGASLFASAGFRSWLPSDVPIVEATLAEVMEWG